MIYFNLLSLSSDDLFQFPVQLQARASQFERGAILGNRCQMGNGEASVIEMPHELKAYIDEQQHNTPVSMQAMANY